MRSCNAECNPKYIWSSLWFPFYVHGYKFQLYLQVFVPNYWNLKSYEKCHSEFVLYKEHAPLKAFEALILHGVKNQWWNPIYQLLCQVVPFSRNKDTVPRILQLSEHKTRHPFLTHIYPLDPGGFCSMNSSEHNTGQIRTGQKGRHCSHTSRKLQEPRLRCSWYLQANCSFASLLTILPNGFVATHWYVPLSWVLLGLLINRLPSTAL